MRFVIADDHYLVLEGLEKAVLNQYPDAEVCLAINKSELDGVLKQEVFDLLILDVKFGPENAKVFLKELRKHYPNLKILIVSSVSDYLSVQLIKSFGVEGYVLKSDSLVEILSAIRVVLKGEVYFSANLPYSEEENDEIILTPREKDVLSLILQEKSTKEIGVQLCISPKTVEMHRSNMFLKFGVKNVTGLVKKTIILGLLDDF